jgi:uncharacterized membrane protein
VVERQPLVVVWPADRCGDDLDRKLTAAFVLGNQRTAAQDVQFPIQQLVEIAIRALSPGINDPFTAVACMDRLASALCRLAGRAPPPAGIFDTAGRLRVVTNSADFANIADTAFAELRQYARSSAMIATHLLETIAVVAHATADEAGRAALLRAAAGIDADAKTDLTNAQDRRSVELRYREARRALGAS